MSNLHVQRSIVAVARHKDIQRKSLSQAPVMTKATKAIPRVLVVRGLQSNHPVRNRRLSLPNGDVLGGGPCAAAPQRIEGHEQRRNIRHIGFNKDISSLN